MKKSFITLLMLLPAFCSVMAIGWIDVTDKYVKNPRFDNNNRSGWLGTPFGAANPKENAEFYNMTYDTYQNLTGLKAGRYRLSLKAFYRAGSYSYDYSIYSQGETTYRNYQYSELYAYGNGVDKAAKIVLLGSGATRSSLGGGTQTVGGRLYVPNNMEAAYYWFEAGYYNNIVECEVGTDGTLTIGIRKYQTISQDWTCLDSWKLEYYGEQTYVSSVKFANATEEMCPFEVKTFVPTVLPAEADNLTLKWTSSNTTVATVDQKGEVTALKTGTAVITATATDGSKVAGSFTLKVVAGTPTAENLVINELMASNVDVYRDPSTNFGSWLELYNPTDQLVSLGGLYVTDDETDLMQHRLVSSYGTLPAHGYAILNFDHHDPWTKAAYRQIDTKLSCDGGKFYITDGTQILTSVEYPLSITRCSYARTTDGGAEWSFTSNPTPGSANQQGGGFATVRLEAPVVDTPAGLFSGSKTVSVSIPVGATLRYTTDGTTPTLTNGNTSETGVFTVSNTTCLRFRLFQDGYLPSAVVTRSYIADNGNEPFPIMSIVTDPQSLFEGDYAIFNYSENGRPGNGQSSAYNANMEWDRPVNFEFITTDNECVISQECDLSSCGGWSRAFTPHSFKLKAGKAYEHLNSFDYQFFSEKPFLKHKVLQIRNGGNDTSCRIKDPALTQIAGTSGLHIEYQSWQPVHVYVNGESYAVLNMREPNNKDYGQSNYGVDTDLMDQFEICPDSGYVQMRGTKESFTRLCNLAKTASDPASYEEICKLVDIDEYVNYMAVELYIGNSDWPQNNVKGFRDVADGKFRFVLFDTDHGFGTSTPLYTFFGKQTYTFDRLYGYDWSKGQSIDGSRLTKENEFVTLFRNMLANDTFRRKFIDAFCIVGGSVYAPERVMEVVSRMETYLSQGYYVSPGGTANGVITSLRDRLPSMISHLKSTDLMQLYSVDAQNVQLSSNIPAAGLLINGMDVPTGKFNGMLFAPVTLTAKAPAGYRFLGWKNALATSSSNTSTVFATDSEWKYYQQSLDNTSWTAGNYSDSQWASGNAPLGYGKVQNTVLTSNLSTYYFRKAFTLSDLKESDAFTLNYTIDDGCVVYVNGQEVGRDNMPSGPVSYNTLATTYAYNNPNTGTLNIPASYFKEGDNVIAVEIHNNNVTSSDILWNAELLRSSENMDIVSTDKEYVMPTAGAQNLVAVWERIEENNLLDRAAAPIKVNEVSAGNECFVNEYIKKDDWVELYNTTDTDLDVAGLYISDNVKKPQKFQISASENINTIIPAHGRIIVWCSKREAVSQIHASFKLDNVDGCLFMVSSSKQFEANNKAYFDAHPEQRNFTDTLFYDLHNYDQSVGRYPDGGNETYLFNHSTIGKANSLVQSDVFQRTDTFKSPEVIILGDVNGDGIVNRADAEMIADYYLGLQPNGFIGKAADVNADGVISIADANVILGLE